MPRYFVLAIICASLAAMLFASGATTAFGQGDALESHPWAKFPVGSWKTVQVISETIDRNGNVANVTTTETRTTLVAVAATGYTLQVQVTVELGGKRFPPQVQTVKYGYHGEAAGQKVAVKALGRKEVTINGRRFDAERRELTIEAEGFSRTSVIDYAATPPYQLHRETTYVPSDPAVKPTTTTVDVVAIDLPKRVLGEVKSSAVVKTLQRHAKGTITTIETHCDDVPGGVVAHAAVERDEQSRVVRRSSLELVDYSIGVGGVEEPTSVVRRRKYNRRVRREEKHEGAR